MTSATATWGCYGAKLIKTPNIDKERVRTPIIPRQNYGA